MAKDKPNDSVADLPTVGDIAQVTGYDALTIEEFAQIAGVKAQYLTRRVRVYSHEDVLRIISAIEQVNSELTFYARRAEQRSQQKRSSKQDGAEGGSHDETPLL